MGASNRSRFGWLTLFLVLVFLSVPFSSVAQITFERTYGGVYADVGFSVQQTQDGGYVIAGRTPASGGGPYDFYLVKTDSLGDSVWTRTYGGVDDDWGDCVRQTQDGGYVIAGLTESFGAGSGDVYLVKTDSVGNSIWTKTYGGDDYEAGCSVQQTRDGGYVIAGRTASFGAGYFDVYLIKTDSVGDTIWTRTYGGPSTDEGASIQQTQDGGYIIVGTTASFDAVSMDVYLVKTDSVGDTMWTRTYGGPDYDFGLSVQQTQDGGYVIAGWAGSPGETDVKLIKTDSLGDSVWTRTYGGVDDDGGLSVQQTQDHGYIIAGWTMSFGAGSGDVYLVKTDSVGNSIWTKTYGGDDYEAGCSVQQTRDGGYVIAGRTASFGAGSDDVYLIKTDENGLTGIGEASAKPLVLCPGHKLFQNHPNPFCRSTVISYSLPSATQVTLTICDISGRLVETLANETEQPGIHEVRWDRKTNPSGVYFYRLTAGELIETRKMVVVE